VFEEIEFEKNQDIILYSSNIRLFCRRHVYYQNYAAHADIIYNNGGYNKNQALNFLFNAVIW